MLSSYIILFITQLEYKYRYLNSIFLGASMINIGLWGKNSQSQQNSNGGTYVLLTL